MTNKYSNKLSKLNSFLEQEYLVFSQFNHLSSPSQIPLYPLLHDKIHDTSPAPLRANFIYHLYKYLKVETDKKTAIPKRFFTQQLPFIIEVVITVQYYHNQILDKKNGVDNPTAINNNLLTANLLKEQLYRYISKLKLPQKVRKKITRCVRSVFEYVDMGQMMEKSHNTYKAFLNQNFSTEFQPILDELVDDFCMNKALETIDQCTPLDKEDAFLKAYLQRIYLTNTALFKCFTQLLTELMATSLETQQKAVHFATFFGLVQQIVNDVTDFVPAEFGENTKAKTCHDAFSDLRNRNITLPVLIHFKRCPKGQIVRYLDSDKMVLQPKPFFFEITHNYSIFFAMTVGKELGKVGLSILELDANNKVHNNLHKFCSMIFNNRYYKYFYSIYRRRSYNAYKKKYR